jgi:pimeloyl-ACP methyl ester carboxylesterase
VLADFLTRRGLAVLRVDDRGVGASTGSLADATLDDLAADALAGVAFLKSRKDIDGARIGLIGHSEGAVAASIAAARAPGTAFLVLLAGSGVPGEQVLYLQGEMISRSTGASEQAIADAHELQQHMIEILRGEKDEFVAIEKIRESWAENRESLDPAVRAQVDAQIIQASSPQMRSFLFHDPAEDLRQVKAPVLALHGSRDMQVPAQQNLPALAAALAENPDVTLVALPGLNHLFQKCNSCLVTEYSALEETISPRALEVLGEWLARHKF